MATPQSHIPPSLWKHTSNGIIFALVVDDFGIKSTSPAATAHLLQALRDKYVITTDPSGTKYLGFTLESDYVIQTVFLSMPEYVRNALHRLQHKMPKRPQHAHHTYVKPAYGKKIYYLPTPKKMTKSPSSQNPPRQLFSRLSGYFYTTPLP